MKRAALDHPKMKMLARRLHITLAHANGLMERLWHFTAKYRPRGDIGFYSDDEIANEAGWEDAAEIFLAALLVPGGFVERHAEHRLVVHDWSEHADDAVHKLLKKKGLAFWDQVPPYSRNIAIVEARVNSNPGIVEVSREQSEIGRDYSRPIRDQSRPISPESRPILECSCLPEPEPEPEPVNTHSAAAQPLLGDFLAPAGPQSDIRPEWEICLDDVALSIHARHPRHRRDISAAKVREKLTTIVRKRGPAKRREELLEIDQNHAAACSSLDWREKNGQFVKKLSNWLAPKDALYSVAPASAEEPSPPPVEYVDATWRPER